MVTMGECNTVNRHRVTLHNTCVISECDDGDDGDEHIL